MNEQQIRERLASLRKEEMELMKQLERFVKPRKVAERKGSSSFMRMADKMINSKWEGAE